MYKLFYIGGIVVSLLLISIVFVNYVTYNRIDSWLERAKDAGNPQQAAEFITKYKSALIEFDLVDGKYYSFFKYPATKMDIYVKVLDALVDRANNLALQISTDTSFQMGLTNLEKDLGDIEARAFSVWLARGGIFILILGIIGCLYTCLGWMPL